MLLGGAKDVLNKVLVVTAKYLKSAPYRQRSDGQPLSSGPANREMGQMMYGNPAFDCGGVQIRAHCRQLATVVSVRGDVDETNSERVLAYMRRFILAEKPFILDLSTVGTFAPHCVSLLHDLNDDCTRTGVDWTVIPNASVQLALRISGDSETFFVAASIPEALHRFADTMDARRQLLPLLTKSA